MTTGEEGAAPDVAAPVHANEPAVLPAVVGAVDAPEADESAIDRRVSLKGRSLRQHTARGTLVNTAFLVGVNVLTLVRGFVLARFVSERDYGIWGVLIVSFGTLLFLKEVGVSDKFVQQNEPDQELAFQRAFTIELVATLAVTVIIAAAVPLVALIYGQSELIGAAYIGLLSVPALALQAPLWIWYRRMDFVRQRLIGAADPVIGFVVALVLAIAGAGYWALIGGLLAGAWSTALVAQLTSPYRAAIRFERGVMKEYVRFSWPLLLAGGAGLIVAQGSILVADAKLGLAGAGFITLSSTITQFAQRVDTIITGTLYPAICAVAEKTELLFESFVKSNRLALMWAIPFGLGLSLFAHDLCQYAIGTRWYPAVPILQAFGIAAAIDHLGFNWTAYLRARGTTKPIAKAATISTGAFLVITLPLLAVEGLRGYAWGMVALTVVNFALRSFYLARMFNAFALGRHAVRSFLPVLPAVALILALRAGLPGSGAGRAYGELALFAVAVAVATAISERRLLREALGYLR